MMDESVPLNDLGTSLLPPVMTMVDDKLQMGKGFLLQQKTSECCRFFCCQPNIDWNMTNYKEEYKAGEEFPVEATIVEDASWCGRTWSCWMPGCRETKYSVFKGEVDTKSIPVVNGRRDLSGLGTPLMTHEKTQTMGTYMLIPTTNGPVPVPMCCNLPYLETKDHTGKILGRTKYICDMFCWVPKFSVENAEGEEIYRIRSDVMCLGCCVRCRCGGKGGKCCRVPYLIRGPDNEKMEDAHITDMWTGVKKECCTKKNTYQVKYPDVSDEDKMILLGSALLVDVTLVEQDQ